MITVDNSFQLPFDRSNLNINLLIFIWNFHFRIQIFVFLFKRSKFNPLCVPEHQTPAIA